jgi:hypothetical protein
MFMLMDDVGALVWRVAGKLLSSGGKVEQPVRPGTHLPHAE